MYKRITPTGVWYITHKFMVLVRNMGEYRIMPFRLGEFNVCMRWYGDQFDKVIEPERKMFWLAFAPVLRTMGVIK